MRSLFITTLLSIFVPMRSFYTNLAACCYIHFPICCPTNEVLLSIKNNVCVSVSLCLSVCLSVRGPSNLGHVCIALCRYITPFWN